MRTLRITLGAWVACAISSQPASIVLTPESLNGSPGQVIGWGFTFSNDTPAFALLTGSELTPPPSAGQYVDFLAVSSDLIVAAPMSSLTQPFLFSPSSNPGKTDMMGLGLFALDAGALSSDGSMGTIFVSYDLYSVDPNSPMFNPATDAISFGNTVSAQAAVTVTPEPSTLGLFAIGLLGLASWRASRRPRMDRGQRIENLKHRIRAGHPTTVSRGY